MPADKYAVGTTIRISTDADQSSGGPYNVVIRAGLVADSGDLIVAAVPSHRYAIITDDNVAPLHARAVAEGLAAAGGTVDTLAFAAGESSKSRASWARLTDELLELGHGRDSCIVVVGGGVAGDLGGFVAATFMRGIPFVNVPTTLLAMLDSAVGGKTGVDTPAGKNLVGVFHQPALVLIDPDVLMTLPEAAYRPSLAEAIKHGVIADAGYFGWIAANTEAIASRENEAVARLVRRSVEIKAAVVAADTREAGVRATLNFGHTLGHALERVTDFAMNHGHAVAIGMVLEAKLGEAIGITEAGTATRIEAVLASFGIPTNLSGVDADAVAILEATRSDKKARGSAVRYALASRIGTMARADDGNFTIAAADDAVLAAAERGRGAISRAGTEF
jgi:3-dehydroquinate synthase